MSNRPNFLVFCTDQLSSLSLHCNGNNEVLTPNIDSIAKEGVTFTRAYVNNSVCMPSRSTMITGLTPRQHGCLTNGTLLPTDVPTITQALGDAGYRTHSVGKLHFQPFNPPIQDDEIIVSWEAHAAWDDGRITGLPQPYYGFQTTDYIGGHVNYVFGDYTNWLESEHPGVRELYSRDSAYEVSGHAWKMKVPNELHYNHWIADRTITYLDSIQEDEPFFLFCSFPDPHHPFAATQPYSELYDPDKLTPYPNWDQGNELSAWMADLKHPVSNGFNKTDLQADIAQTYGMISHVDENVGRVMTALRKRGLDDNTIVVFMADHGEYLGSHHLLYKSVWPWEPLLRVPYIWRVPKGVSLAGGTDQLVSLLDFAPTILDYAGVNPMVLSQRSPAAKSEWPGLPGRSLRSYLDTGDPLPEQPVISEYDEDWDEGRMIRRRTIITKRYKLSVFPMLGDGILVDLQEDPFELNNLWGDPSYASVQASLTAELLERLIWSDRLTGPRICGA